MLDKAATMLYNIVIFYVSAANAPDHRTGMGDHMNFDKSQLMRGTLEGCILKIISQKTTYGYEIMEYLRAVGFRDMAEGTIYPLLMRLEKQGNISAALLPSPLGPKRKYFTITESGKQYLESFEACWNQLFQAVSHIMKTEVPADEQ